MVNNQMESLIDSIRNIYNNKSIEDHSTLVEISTLIQSKISTINDNKHSLYTNLLSLFPLPKFTLPHIVILSANIKNETSDSSNTSSNSNSTVPATNETPTTSTSPSIADTNPTTSSTTTTHVVTPSLNKEHLLNDIENCIQNSDSKQVFIHL
jgi:hypothetical protein